MDKKLIDEVNRLAKKKREVGLTEEEQKQQDKLRQQYIKEFKSNFKKMLENIEVVGDYSNDN